MESTPHDRNPDDRLRQAVAAYHAFARQGGDPEEFLARHEDLRDLLSGFLATESAATTDAAGDLWRLPLVEGAVLDDFRILREIGRGGMGVVYEAEQLSLGRRVALKVLPASFGLSDARVERFTREAAATARLHHHGILPVYCIGEAEGLHFFAMELIEGPSLHEALSNARGAGAGGPGRRGLGVHPDGGWAAEIADVVAQIAEGLNEAHEHHVVHRDVKPENILLDKRTEPHRCVRVVDFGIAQDFDAATVSATQGVVGTPRYMSPEQIEGPGRVDARSDVFSLGVVLYECLALEPPFIHDTPLRAMHAILHADPLPLRQVDPTIPADLEVICAKAMEKSPTQRYQTAAEFAADLRRFLRHEPIVARPPSAWRRLRFFVRRNRGKSALVAVALLLTVFGLGGYLTHLEVTNRALGVEQAATQRQRDRALTNLTSAHTALNRLLEQVEVMATRPGMEDVHRQATEDVVAFLDELVVENLGTSPQEQEVLRLAFRARSRLTRTWLWMGDRKRALAQVEGAERVLRVAEQRLADAACRELRAQLAHWRGMIAFDREPAAAERALRAAIDHWRSVVPEEPSGTHRQALGEAQALIHLARLLLVRGLAAGLREALQLLAAAEVSVGRLSVLGEDHKLLSWIRHAIASNRSLVQINLGDLAGARTSVDIAVHTGRQRVERAPRDPRVGRDLVVALRTRAEMAQRGNQVEPAVRDYTEALEICRRVVADFPTRRAWKIELAGVLLHRIGFAGLAGEAEVVREHIAEARAVLDSMGADPSAERRRLLGRCDAATGLCVSEFDRDPVAALGHFGEAVKHLREAIAARPERGGYRADLSQILYNRAQVERAAGRTDAALSSSREAFDEQLEFAALSPMRSARWIQTIADGLLTELMARGDHAAAAQVAQRLATRLGENGRVVLHAANVWGRCQQMAAADEGLAADYGRAAVAALQKAVELGYRGLRTLQGSPDFAGLREDPAFRAVLAEIAKLRKK